MQVRTKSVDFFDAHKASSAANNWAIGWTLAEASAAARRGSSAHSATANQSFASAHTGGRFASKLQK